MMTWTMRPRCDEETTWAEIGLTLAVMLCAQAFIGCAAPCKSVAVLSAYEAELEQCVRLTTTRDGGYACIADVEARYLSRFADVGIDALSDLKELRDELVKSPPK